MANHPAAIDHLLRHPYVDKLFAFGHANDLDIRLVGGAVRDALAGWTDGLKKEADLDFAVNIPIERFIPLAQDAGYHIIPTGLSHGTVTVIDGGNKAEITQLRYDLDTDGRHADTCFTDDWAADAHRRDFTINAIYLDGAGQLFDPCGGIADLAARQLRFIGEAKARLEEDYLRLLRAIRFLSEYPELEMSSTELMVIKAEAENLARLSAERNTAETSRIFAGQGVDRAVRLIHRLGIDRQILGAPICPKFTDSDRSPLSDSQMASWFRKSELADQLVLVASDSKALEIMLTCRLKLSRHQQKKLLANSRLLSSRDELATASQSLSGDDWQKSCFRLGNLASFAYLHGCFSDAVRWQENRMRQIVHFVPPTCPISGQDVIVRYDVTGREVGVILDALTTRWIDSDFTLSKSELLS